HTLADKSVKQDPADILPTKYQQTTSGGTMEQSVSQGTLWQFGSGFTAFDGPPLATDAAGSRRVYAFFNPESYPGDGGIGGHLIGFASVSVPAGAHAIPPLWSSVWKDATSPNDGDYKLTNNIPLRTLYLREVTPVIAFRGDERIRENIAGGRMVTGMTGWYRSGYLYLYMSTYLSFDASDYRCFSPPLPTVTISGMALFRIRVDLTGTSGFGGLWLDASKRPQVELYRSTIAGGPK